MSLFDRSVAVWNRPDRIALAVNIASFVGATIILNGVIFAFGIDRRAEGVARLSWAPPGWAIGAIWVLLFALYAIAFWLLLQRQESGRRAAHWVLAIVACDLAHPLLTNGFDLKLGAWLNVVTGLFTVLLLWRVWQDSSIAFGWLIGVGALEIQVIEIAQFYVIAI